MSITSLDDPKIKEFDVLIEVAFSGICGTDLNIFNGLIPDIKYPIIPGHEFSGIIVSKGKKVTQYDIGQKVAVNPNLSCRSFQIPQNQYCFYCKRNRPHFCINWEAIGITRQGAFAEKVAVPYNSIFLLPNSVSLLEGALMEPIACCLNGLNKLTFQPNYTVLILGAGSIGLLMVMLIKKLHNCKVFVSEPRKSRRELAKKFGTNLVFDSLFDNKGPIKNLIKQETDNQGVDIIIECVGNSKLANLSIDYLNKGGQLLCFGVPNPHENLQINLYEIYKKEYSIYGSFTNPHDNQNAIQLLSEKLINPIPMISHQLSLDNFEHGINLLKNYNDNVNEDINKIVIKINS